MSYEWHAAFRLELEQWAKMKQEAKGALRKRGKKAGPGAVRGEAAKIAERQLRATISKETKAMKPYASLQILSQTIGAEDEDQDANWDTIAKGLYSQSVLSTGSTYDKYIRDMLDHPFANLCFSTPQLQESDLARLPEHSFFLYIPFTLSAPYISKDDEPFYVHENPVRKEWVLKVPYMSSTSWKGAFRAALRYTLGAYDNDPRIVRLMGNAKGEPKDFRRGRLTFFPTFFDQLEVGVINPHSRETGAGSKPIHIEQVPRGASGKFALLYVPMIARPVASEKEFSDIDEWTAVREDLESIGLATRTLFAELGFGAKTASGMGRASDDISGAYLLMNWWVERPPELPEPPLTDQPPQRFQPESDEFLDKGGQWPYYETDEEMKAHIIGNKARTRYKKQRIAYREWHDQREPWVRWEREVAELSQRRERTLVRVGGEDLKCLEDLGELREQVEKQTKEADHD